MVVTDSRLVALQILHRWGLRISGSSLKDPTKRATGGHVGIDDDQLLVEFVESTPKFRVARPVLVHRYVHGLELSDFRLNRPDESKDAACYRLGWGSLTVLPKVKIIEHVHDHFVNSLVERLEEIPQGGPPNFYFL